ncbi:MAG: SEL1-like repeat protein [Akkermansia sp.]|nr:SEL1-like repeat protein [Akkermansia sp.]
MSEILSPALPTGYMLRDTYTITAQLGHGGFGITYLAVEDVTERRVVIKENYPGEFSMRNSANHTAGPAGESRKENYEWALGAFLNEAKVLTRLRHPNIVPVLTAFRALGTAYYVMDYIGDKPLLKAAPSPHDITEQYLLSILRPLLSALHYLHTQPEPLLHRDLKPDNILIDSKGSPIIIDFGAARSTMSTHTHSKVGTPGYAPLEQWSNGAKRGPWTDLYSLAATCYRLLTGQEPPDCHERVYADPDSELLATRPELRGRFSPALLSSIDKAFAMRPSDRWQSAQDWLNALSGTQTEAATVQPEKTAPLSPPTTAANDADIVAQAQQLIDRKQYDGVPALLRPAAENGYAQAQNLLGDCYYDGHGVPQDYAQAVQWYRKAAEQGDADAQCSLGACYYSGHGVPQDYAEAVQWYRKAAEQGDADAQICLGVCYLKGHGVPQDYTQTVQWYRKAAEQGHAAAQNNLGDCYDNGYGVPQDNAQAVQWFRKAAEQGHANAQYYLGDCYYNGEGVPEDNAQAVQWFRKAAEQGNDNAQFMLGMCYYYGHGVPKDHVQAVHWYHKAAEQGNDDAQEALDEIFG